VLSFAAEALKADVVYSVVTKAVGVPENQAEIQAENFA
jgi:hypothetical protein